MKAKLMEESPWFKLMIVLVLAIGGTFLFLLLGILLLPFIFNTDFGQLTQVLSEVTDPGSIKILKFLQGFNTVGTFLFPALAGAYLFSRDTSHYLRIDDFPKKGLLVTLLLLIIAFSGVVVSDLLYRFSTLIPFPDFLQGLKEYFDSTQQIMNEQIGAFLQMDSLLEFFEVFLILAVLPALCEETLFRGVIQPLLIKGFGRVSIGIIVTSLLFGMLHQQFYSFLSIVVLSVVLGYLREWSQSLWVPVILHLINNGTIVVGVYFFDLPVNDLQQSSEDMLDPWQTMSGVLVFAASLVGMYYVLKSDQHQQNRE